MKRKRIAVGLIIVLLLAAASSFVYYFRIAKDSKNDSGNQVDQSSAIEEYLKTEKEPNTVASQYLVLSGLAEQEKDYDSAIDNATKALNVSGVRNDIAQSARLSLTILLSNKGDYAQALQHAEAYKAAIDQSNIELAAKETAYIDTQIKKLQLGEKLSSVGGSEEGE